MLPRQLVTQIDGSWGQSPVHTKWIFTWSRAPDGAWRATDIRWKDLEGAEPVFGIWR